MNESHGIKTTILLLILGGIILSGFIFLFLESTNISTHTEIGHTSQIISCISIGLTGVTIYLLYINYKQQQVEMNKLNLANKSLVAGNLNSNDIQLILHEKRLIENDFIEYEKAFRSKANNGFNYFVFEINLFLQDIIKEKSKIKIDSFDSLIKLLDSLTYPDYMSFLRAISMISRLENKLEIISKIIHNRGNIKLVSSSVPTQVLMFANILVSEELGLHKLRQYIDIDYLQNDKSLQVLNKLCELRSKLKVLPIVSSVQLKEFDRTSEIFINSVFD